MLREQISAQACRLRDAWGAESAGGDPAVPAGAETVWLGRAGVIYSSGARPRACEWREDKEQIRRASAASFPPGPVAPAAQPGLTCPVAMDGRGQLSGEAGGATGSPLAPARAELVGPGASATRMQWQGVASLEFIHMG